MRVLIAEDDPNIAASLLKSFSDENIQTIIAKDGEQALHFINAEKGRAGSMQIN